MIESFGRNGTQAVIDVVGARPLIHLVILLRGQLPLCVYHNTLANELPVVRQPKCL
jgi:hypothetical protein